MAAWADGCSSVGLVAWQSSMKQNLAMLAFSKQTLFPFYISLTSFSLFLPLNPAFVGLRVGGAHGFDVVVDVVDWGGVEVVDQWVEVVFFYGGLGWYRGLWIGGW